MKKLALILGVLSLVACTDQKVVNYNTARLDNIEAYLANNKAVKPSENLDKLVEEGEEVAVAQEEVTPKKARKDMTESEKMDLEVQRIKKRMLEINDKIENYNKTNEMLDNLEKNVGELEKRVRY